MRVADGCFFEPAEDDVIDPVVGRKKGSVGFSDSYYRRRSALESIPDNFEDECHSVFKNVKTVIEESGARWEDLVDITVFLTNMEKDFDTFNSIYKKYFKEDHKPCRTTLEIKSLPTPISISAKLKI